MRDIQFVFLKYVTSHILTCAPDNPPGVPWLRPCRGMRRRLLQNVKLAVCFYVKGTVSSLTLTRRDAFRECEIKINFISGCVPTVKSFIPFNRSYSTGKWRYTDSTSELNKSELQLKTKLCDFITSPAPDVCYNFN